MGTCQPMHTPLVPFPAHQTNRAPLSSCRQECTLSPQPVSHTALLLSREACFHLCSTVPCQQKGCVWWMLLAGSVLCYSCSHYSFPFLRCWEAIESPYLIETPQLYPTSPAVTVHHFPPSVSLPLAIPQLEGLAPCWGSVVITTAQCECVYRSELAIPMRSYCHPPHSDSLL